MSDDRWISLEALDQFLEEEYQDNQRRARFLALYQTTPPLPEEVIEVE